MLHDFFVSVHYPLKKGKLVLRTEFRWDRDSEPVKVNADQTVFDFHLKVPSKHFYFRPFLLVDGAELPAKGESRLAITTARQHQIIHPYFFGDESGDITELEEFPWKDGRLYRIRTYYPPGYQENTTQRYPVLYMHDGGNLFYPEEAFLHVDWKVDEVLEILNQMNMVEKVIIVGIHPADRMADYTHPGYMAYGEFIVTRLKPTIDARCRTLPDAANTAIMGSSLGGLVSLFLAWQWPRVFGKAACMSSTFERGFDNLTRRIQQERKRKIQIYLDSGWPQDNYEQTLMMYHLLLQHGYVFGKDLLYFAFPNDRHSESFWGARCHIPFQFFFRKR
ncbi:MAG: hypothetical protein K1Y36_21395 [Blastocatellia bacterium]|nr:hypothetical protein [Blastocatellia bacterium]